MIYLEDKNTAMMIHYKVCTLSSSEVDIDYLFSKWWKTTNLAQNSTYFLDWYPVDDFLAERQEIKDR